MVKVEEINLESEDGCRLLDKLIMAKRVRDEIKEERLKGANCIYMHLLRVKIFTMSGKTEICKEDIIAICTTLKSI